MPEWDCGSSTWQDTDHVLSTYENAMTDWLPDHLRGITIKDDPSYRAAEGAHEGTTLAELRAMYGATGSSRNR